MVTTTTGPVETVEQTLEHLKRDVANYMATVKQGDLARCVALYEDDAIIVPTGGLPYISKEGVTRFMNEYLDTTEITDVQMPVEDLGAGPALAYHAAIFDMYLRPRGGGPVSLYSNKGIELWRRQPDGQWKVRLDLFNNSVAAEPPQQKLLKELTELTDRCAACMVAGNLDGLEQCFAANVVIMAPEQPPLSGWLNARAWIGASLEEFAVESARIRVHSPIACGELYYCGCQFSFELRRRTDGTPEKWVGDGVMLVRREPDGLLRVLWDLWPLATPFEPAPEARDLDELIEKKTRQYEKDVMEANAEGWASYFDENAMVMPNNAPLFRDRASLLEFGRAFLNAFAFQSIRLDTVELEIAGDWAFRRLQYRNRMTAKLTGERYLNSGHALEIWTKKGDTWTVTHSMWTVDPSVDNVQDPASGMSQTEFEQFARIRVAGQNDVFLRNDVEMFGNYFAPEARLAGDLFGPMHGRTAYCGLIGSTYFDRFVYKVAENRVIEAVPLGEYGAVLLALRFGLQPKHGGDLEYFTGSCIELWKRQPDGSWLTVDCIWTSDKPAA